MREGWAVRVRGLVQGVGFRPHVWRLARDCGLAGEVRNDSEGVGIRAWGAPDALEAFVRRLREEAPPLARIDGLEAMPLAGEPEDAGFHIVASHAGRVRTAIVPDAATCPDCLAETRDPAARRHRYPFTNCTHCGPRLSIVRAIPYDRGNTSMAKFALCPECRAEYADPEDRRFHAQPLACPACGPRVWLERLAGPDSPLLAAADAIVAAADLLSAGAILAVKGIGGFHLACDAGNEAAVAALRARKRRDQKPFALMACDIEAIGRYCAVDGREEALLRSAAAPIVILRADGPERVARGVAPGQRSLGFMLPYTPLHHLLLDRLERPIVLTSGNLSEEPQCTGNDEARQKLGAIANYGLFHDRDIVNRTDDSVARVVAGGPFVLRRARGYAPAPIALPAGFAEAPPVLALGGELKSTFCLAAGGQAILSQHLGDLEDAASFADYRRTLALYRGLFDHEPRALAIDRHPEYLSAKLGREWAAESGIALEEIQHHHAHVASCMAENGVPLESGPVLGIALDGLGYGGDGGLWGGEFLLADYAGFERLGNFAPVAMPGGAQAAREPWRNTYAHLDAAIGWERCARDHAGLDLVRFLGSRPLAMLDAMRRNRVNSPLASSCGRLFDAVAAALGICRERASYEGQAAIELEAQVDERAFARDEGYEFRVEWNPDDGAAPALLDSAPMWPSLMDDLARAVPVGVVAARFHRGLARAIARMALLILGRDPHPTRTIALSGGSFQNRLLLETVTGDLRGHGLEILTHRQVPANDGGLSLGQAAIAASRLLLPPQAIAGRVFSWA
jgi:hydrogenase maturation protein HypF